MEIVNIEDKAFIGILLAAVEAYPSKYCGGRKPKGASAEGEVHGLLFGQRIMKDGETTIYKCDSGGFKPDRSGAQRQWRKRFYRPY